MPLSCESANSDSRGGQVRIIGLFEPDLARAAMLMGLLAGPGRRITVLGDPTLSVRDWLNCGFDLALVNPFAAVGTMEDVVALTRRIAGQRPILALTMQVCAEQRTRAIASGADDAIEPASAPEELATRIYALLRRRALTAGLLACDDLQIDLLSRSVQRGDRMIMMPAREFELLAELAKTPDQIVSRNHLLRSVWRLDFDPGTNRVEVHVSRLRNRLDAGERWPLLRTYKGQGYALVSRDSWLAEQEGRASLTAI
jgi:two-component system OmpR family response regulator